MAYENYNIEQFMAAWFNQNYESLSKEEFKIVYAEYLDTSGLFMSEDFENRSYILHLNGRINYIKLFVRLQREFMKDFEMAFIRDFEELKERYGHVLKWNGSVEDFEKQLQKIESREIKHSSLLEDKIKQLNDSRKRNQGKEIKLEEGEELKKSRLSFIRMINSLGKIGYKISKKETTVEELALMIKQQLEDVEDQKNR